MNSLIDIIKIKIKQKKEKRERRNTVRLLIFELVVKSP